MPPKKQITKQQIIDKAFEIVRSEGYEFLTARKLAKELNCSTQPIYQALSDMKELKLELIKKAQEEMMGYIKAASNKALPFELEYIIAYIQFARNEKYLYQLIFSSGDLKLFELEEKGTAKITLDINMIIYANGIVMMQAFNSLAISDEMLKDMLIHAYELFKSNKSNLGCDHGISDKKI
jgi:AcrR family transcriptional regulator